ncbi:MAG: ABC transporter substrate-binding protein [bacterium]|nr:ABC transporter substrate-binding protein [bacterium]
MKRKVMALSMAAVMAASLTACGGASSTSTTAASGDSSTSTTAASGDTTTAAASGDQVNLKICWWGNQIRNDVTKKAVDLYMSQNPNVKIDIEFTDWSGYWDKLSAMAAGGNLPDIIQMDYSYLNQYQKSSQLADLTPYLEDGTIDHSKIPDSIIESGSIDGKCYALSLGSNAPVMVYDKAITDEAGVTIPEQPTIEELYEIGNTIYEKTEVKTYYDGGINMMQIVARGNGSHLFDEIAANTVDSLAKHFAYVEQFNTAEAAISPDLLAEKNPDLVETKPIIDSTTWNDFSFSNQFVSIVNAAGRDLAVCMYPQAEDATTQPMYLKPSQFFSIAETSQNKEEAAKFLNWFTNDVDCNKILLGERGVPVNTEVAEAIKGDLDANTQLVFDYVTSVGEIATPIDAPDPAGKGEIEALGKTKVEDLRYGDGTAEEIATSFLAEANKILTEAAQ